MDMQDVSREAEAPSREDGLSMPFLDHEGRCSVETVEKYLNGVCKDYPPNPAEMYETTARVSTLHFGLASFWNTAPYTIHRLDSMTHSYDSYIIYICMFQMTRL